MTIPNNYNKIYQTADDVKNQEILASVQYEPNRR